MSVKCELCGRQFKNTQGLRGHMTFVHGQTGSSTPVARLATEQQPSKPEERLQKLESAIGLKEPRGLRRLRGIDESITEQLERQSRELGELYGRVGGITEQLENISEQIKLASSNSEVRDIRRQVTQLSEQVKRHDSWLTTSRLYYILTMHSEHPAFLDDIVQLRRKLEEHQLIITQINKRLNY